MTYWYEVSCGKQLMAEFNTIAPNRDHASDGTIGDTAHQQENSDHNPDSKGAVRAIDVDNDLHEPGLDFETVVQFILERCRNGSETRITYIIYNRRIWEQDNGWRQRPYNGTSPHTEHGHFSFSHNDKVSNNTRSFRLDLIPVALTSADKEWITGQIGAAYLDTNKATGQSETVVGNRVLSQGIPDGTLPGTPQTPGYMVIQHMCELLLSIKDAVATIENTLDGMSSGE